MLKARGPVVCLGGQAPPDKRRFLRLMVLPPPALPPSLPNEYTTLKMCTKGNVKIDAGRRSIDPIRDSLKREAHFRREITRELAIWPLAPHV